MNKAIEVSTEGYEIKLQRSEEGLWGCLVSGIVEQDETEPIYPTIGEAFQEALRIIEELSQQTYLARAGF